jgi:hypothetical protein
MTKEEREMRRDVGSERERERGGGPEREEKGCRDRGRERERLKKCGCFYEPAKLKLKKLFQN